MKTKIFKVVIGFGIFTAGVILGKQIQKSTHRKHSIYSGTLQVHSSEDSTDLYLVLSVPPENLIGLADVIFKVDTIKIK